MFGAGASTFYGAFAPASQEMRDGRLAFLPSVHRRLCREHRYQLFQVEAPARLVADSYRVVARNAEISSSSHCNEPTKLTADNASLKGYHTFD